MLLLLLRDTDTVLNKSQIFIEPHLLRDDFKKLLFFLANYFEKLQATMNVINNHGQ